MKNKIKVLKNIKIFSLEELQTFAHEMTHLWKPGDIIILTGDLGAGKTTFIQMFGKALGITEEITSPTFTIINEYTAGAPFPIYHFDFYRLKDLYELKGINLDDYLFGSGICLLEWGEKIEPVLPFPHYHLMMHIVNEKERLLKLEKHDE